jgi:single-strand DNA-binding protein
MKSVNKVILLGNLTRDPELHHTEHNKAVCAFGLATNRNWTTETGEKREEPEYHRLVAWEKLAEFCSKYLCKGRKVYVEGRLQSRSYTGQDGIEKHATEIVIDDMVMLDSMPKDVREALDFHQTQ